MGSYTIVPFSTWEHVEASTAGARHAMLWVRVCSMQGYASADTRAVDAPGTTYLCPSRFPLYV